MTVSSQTGPCSWRARSDQRKAKHSRSVGRKFNKQGNLHMRLVLSSRKTSRSPHLPTRILKKKNKVYVEALMGFSLMYCTDGPNDILLSQVQVLENSSGCGNGKTCPLDNLSNYINKMDKSQE